MVHQLSSKLLPLQKGERSSSKSSSYNSRQSATRPQSASKPLQRQQSSSLSRSNSVGAKPQSAYGSFGPAPKKNYTIIKSEPLDKPLKSKAKKCKCGLFYNLYLFFLKTASNTKSREPSRSPFRRFDPTGLVFLLIEFLAVSRF